MGRVAPSRIDFASVAEPAVAADSEQIVSFGAALRRLEVESGDSARAVQLRFLVVLSVEQTARAMGASDREVDRLRTFARAWVSRAVREVEVKD